MCATESVASERVGDESEQRRSPAAHHEVIDFKDRPPPDALA